MTQGKPSVLIVGGGIIGAAAAARLADEGHAVTVVDRSGICEETSAGNAAAFAFSDLLPLAQKGMLRQVPRWLMDPLGPLSIPPRHFLPVLPWLLRFLTAGRPGRFEAALSAQAQLMELARGEWASLTALTGTEGFLRRDGCLELYDSEASFNAAGAGYAARERHGVAFEVVDKAHLADFQPGLSDHFARGVFIPGWMTVSDPQVFGKALFSFAQSRGALFVQAGVESVEMAPDGPSVRLGDGKRLKADRVVIAAGAWSHRLAGPLGDRIPLETERGYNTTLPPGAFDLKRQLVFCDHGFVATPLETGIRIGGAVELGGLSLAPDYRRSRAMLDKAKRFLPALKTGGGREWMGYRPSLPDSLPVIGASAAGPQIVHAFGHGHLGLTQAAATARLVRDIVCGQAPAIDLSPFSAQRF
ncbi:MAG: amino acid dehydrogenase [Phyllobacteriaceae bacterium]|nr:amino acid dehydrogenase [Phyllobacteriaceae bacterium]MBA92237.1 amino acid dehydrogenase [Phyllobacteriaceae bacterium]